MSIQICIQVKNDQIHIDVSLISHSSMFTKAEAMNKR